MARATGHQVCRAVLYDAEYWLSAKEKSFEFIDAFLSDPSLCRLYLGLSKLDRDTAESERQARIKEIQMQVRTRKDLDHAKQQLKSPAGPEKR